MIDVKVLNEWIELDTLNGYYCLDDIYKSIGSPEDRSPRAWFKNLGGVPLYSMGFTTTKTWANQVHVYKYCAWLCPNFKAKMEEFLASKDITVALAISTGVMHK